MNKLDFAPPSLATMNSVAMMKAPQSSCPFEHLPIGICTCDRDGKLLEYNRRAAEFWGVSPDLAKGPVRYSGAYKVFSPDGTPLPPSGTPIAEALRTGKPVRDRELVLERPDGSRLHILANADLQHDASGHVAGAIDCFQDITKQKRAEQKAQDQERSYRELLNALPAAIYTTDADGKITFYNRAAAELAGREPELHRDSWCVTWRLYTPEGVPLPHDQCPMAIELKEGRKVRGVEAMAERPDGALVPFIAYPSPLHDAEGHIVGGVNMLVDISERKLAEERQQTMIGELNHRVRNTLATIQALAAQTMRGEGIAKELREAFGARLLALSRVHGELTRSSWQSADLRTIVTHILGSYGEDRVQLDGESVSLTPKTAVALAMVLHELASNAAKFGALSTMAGRLRVGWKVRPAEPAPILEIDWNESGGPEVQTPALKGFGRRLVERGIGGDLQGTAELKFERPGVQCRIRVPLAKRE